MSDRIEEIRNRLNAADGLKARLTVECHDGKPDSANLVWDVMENATADLNFLLAEVDRQAAQLARIKAALMAAGCSDYTDDVARMAEEYLAQPEEG